MKNALWCITGAGGRLREIARAVLRIREECGARFTIGFSKWGYEVSRIYGLRDLLRRVASGEYMEEWLVEEEGYYYIGRLGFGVYSLLLIAPATSNSIAKMVGGISDTLPTLAFSQALKFSVPVIVFPSDIPNSSGYAISELPCRVDRERCKCVVEIGRCPIASACPAGAIEVVRGGFARINLRNCVGCELCVEKCAHGAVECWGTIEVRPSEIDMNNIERLSKLRGVRVVSSIDEMVEEALRALGEGPWRDRSA